MDSNTEQLIRELADKLGVSLEKLWDILIVQAKYSAIGDLTSMVVCFVLTIFLFRYLIKILKQRKTEETTRITKAYNNTEDYNSISARHERYIRSVIEKSSWPDRELVIFIIVLIGTVMFGFITLIYTLMLPNLVTRLLNPEFGAIEILQKFITVR
jgi:hypothetical protein